jgi:apolipoprotein N-acyltransferase
VTAGHAARRHHRILGLGILFVLWELLRRGHRALLLPWALVALAIILPVCVALAVLVGLFRLVRALVRTVVRHSSPGAGPPSQSPDHHSRPIGMADDR